MLKGLRKDSCFLLFALVYLVSYTKQAWDTLIKQLLKSAYSELAVC